MNQEQVAVLQEEETMSHNEEQLNLEIFNTIKKNFWSVYESNTTILSNICRQLAFAEGGICWFFKTPASQSCFSNEVSSILMLLVVFFLIDGMQYLANSMIYGGAALYYECKNNKGLLKNIRDVDRKHSMNILPLILFFIKLIFLSIASCLIIKLLIK